MTKCSSKTTNKKKCIAISFTVLTTIFTSVPLLADIGSKHADQHLRDVSKKPVKINTQPFDYSDIYDLVESLHQGSVEYHLGAHIEQAHLESLPADLAFIEAFELGDELFEIDFNSVDGAGVNVGNGQRFTNVPRADLNGPEQWASVMPHRITGPNGTSCLGCHNMPVADGGGGINDNTIRIDPERQQKGFIERQSPHIHGMGSIQLLAEEMTTDLHAIRDDAIMESCNSGQRKTVSLVAKSIDFGKIEVSCNNVRYKRLSGIDKDLVVKPFEWKGLTAFVRDFVRGASHQELGMQATELVGNIDSDFDGVSNELSVGDITSLAIYSAGQQRPVNKIELNQISHLLNDTELDRYGLPLTVSEAQNIERGEQVFNKIGCASCHAPALTVSSPIFSEPSLHPDYRDSNFPAGEHISMPKVAIQFNITEDIFVNSQRLPSGQRLGEFERDTAGGAIVRLYGDLKRHDMGRGLAEEIDEGNVGASVFLTENLWGVGSTPPYLHDGRASTLTEAILYHGGEAQTSNNMFTALSQYEQEQLLAFLNNLVLYIEP